MDVLKFPTTPSQIISGNSIEIISYNTAATNYASRLTTSVDCKGAFTLVKSAEWQWNEIYQNIEDGFTLPENRCRYDTINDTLRMCYIIRKRWRATAWCGKSKFAISSGWLKNGGVCHPDDIITLSYLIRMRYQFQLSHPDDIWWNDMSSGWHTTESISHPDEKLPIVKSSGWDIANN